MGMTGKGTSGRWTNNSGELHHSHGLSVGIVTERCPAQGPKCVFVCFVGGLSDEKKDLTLSAFALMRKRVCKCYSWPHKHTHVRTHSDLFIRVCGAWKLPCHSQAHIFRRTTGICWNAVWDRQTVGLLNPSVTFHILKICNFNKSVSFFPCLTCKASYNIMTLFSRHLNHKGWDCFS